MEKQGVPMNQFPQSPDVAQQQPPTYVQDPAQQPQQQPFVPGQMYQQPPQQHMPPQQFQTSHPGSPAPSQQQGYISPQMTGTPVQPAPFQPPQPQHPGMPQQAQSGTVYQNATPIASLNRSPAPADCPACGQRSLTNTSFETGNTTHAWALALCCLICLGCIPYVMSSTKDVRHNCGRCGVLLATWHRSGTTEVHIHS